MVSSGFYSFGSVDSRRGYAVMTLPQRALAAHRASRKYAKLRRGSNYLVGGSGLKVRTSQPGASTSTIHCPTHSRQRSVTRRIADGFTALGDERNHAFGKHVSAQVGQIAQSNLHILRIRRRRD